MSNRTRARRNVVAASLPAREILGNDRAYDTVVTELSHDGLSMTAAGDMGDFEGARYVWVEFTLPDEPKRIRALGELVHCASDSQVVRFKHVFPDHRRSIDKFLASRGNSYDAAAA